MNPPTEIGAPPTPPKKKGNGVTTPSRRGGSGRVLTDVIVDLGFVEQGVMDEVIARSEDQGALPEYAAVYPDGDPGDTVTLRLGGDVLTQLLLGRHGGLPSASTYTVGCPVYLHCRYGRQAA